MLRKDVQFHDGADFTSEDVKATFDRIAKPPQGISIPRSTLFAAVEEITAPDKYTVQFKLSEPRPANFIMSAGASGWNGIVRKKTLEDNGYNLRRVVGSIPGTGPFKSQRRVEAEIWVMEKNKNYWNKGLPYLDGIEFYHALPFSPNSAPACSPGRVDYARLLDPVSQRRVKSDPGHVRHRLLPERHPGHLDEQRRSRSTIPGCRRTLPSRARQACARRRGEGYRADDGGRLHLIPSRNSPRRCPNSASRSAIRPTRRRR